MSARITVFKANESPLIVDSLSKLTELQRDADSLIWVDLTEPEADEAEAAAEIFGAPDFIVEDLTKGGQRPKIHTEEGFVFIVAYGINLDGGTDDICRNEVSILLNERIFLTVRHDPSFDIEPVTRRLAAVRDVYERGVTLLLYDLLDEIVDGYFDSVDKLESAVDDAEQLVFTESNDLPAREREIQERIFRIRKKVVTFYQISTAMRDILNGILRHDIDFFPEKTHLYFLDIYDHLLRVNASLELFRDLIGGMFEAHLAVVSNQMDRVMKKMTSWGAILLGATLIAGIYGMNFHEMPELRFIYGYPMALGLMGALTITLWIVFKKKNWL